MSTQIEPLCGKCKHYTGIDDADSIGICSQAVTLSFKANVRAHDQRCNVDDSFDPHKRMFEPKLLINNA